MTPRAGDVSKRVKDLDLPENLFPIPKELCERCGYEMKKMTTCHLICTNCGSHLDCSDKGTVW